MNTLSNKSVAQTLSALHKKAEADHILRDQQRKAAAEHGTIFDHSWSSAYLAVSANEGRFLNFLAKVTKAKSIVEFGCSFGISTIYLAAAAKDNGGRVITTDIEPNKIAGAGKILLKPAFLKLLHCSRATLPKH
jgi:predicted O-methyltransferase YrrM